MVLKGFLVAFGIAVLIVGPLPQLFPYFNQIVGVALIGFGWYLIRKAREDALNGEE